MYTNLLGHDVTHCRPTGSAGGSENLGLLHELLCTRGLVYPPGHRVVRRLVLRVNDLLSLPGVWDSGEGDGAVGILRGGGCDEVGVPWVGRGLHTHLLLLLLLLLLGGHRQLLLGTLRGHHLHGLAIEVRRPADNHLTLRGVSVVHREGIEIVGLQVVDHDVIRGVRLAEGFHGRRRFCRWDLVCLARVRIRLLLGRRGLATARCTAVKHLNTPKLRVGVVLLEGEGGEKHR